MLRREFVASAASAAVGLALPNRQAAQLPIYYELHGNPNGRPLLLGFPVMASYPEIFGAANGAVKQGFLERLTDRYRILLIDYPNVGKTMTPPPGDMTADRVCGDLLSVADAAGFDRFGYCGHLWGAIIGLLLASRTDRISALVAGTWPVLGAPYPDMLRGVKINLPDPPPHTRVILRDAAQYAQWLTFYRSIQAWPEAESVARIKCPRLAIIGSKAESDVAGIPLRLVERFREGRGRLEAMGWQVTEVPDRDTGLMLDPASIVPPMRRFLDAVE